MGRPMQKIRVQRNGNSFSVFQKGRYVGNITGRELCALVQIKKEHKTEYTQFLISHMESI